MEGAGEASKLAALSVLATPIQEWSNQEIKCRWNDTLLPASDYRIVKTDSSYYLVDGENRYYWTETCDLVEEVD
jgi:hypothetical protein